MIYTYIINIELHTHTHSGIFLSHEDEGKPTSGNNPDEPQGHYAK